MQDTVTSGSITPWKLMVRLTAIQISWSFLHLLASDRNILIQSDNHGAGVHPRRNLTGGAGIRWKLAILTRNQNELSCCYRKCVETLLVYRKQEVSTLNDQTIP